jgi:hypothetical protein
VAVAERPVQLVIDHAARPEQSAGGLVLPVQVTDRQNPGHGGELGGTRHLRLGADPDRWQIKARNIEREALAHMNPAFDPLAVTDGDDAGTIRFPEHVGTVADRRGGLLGKRRAPTSRDDCVAPAGLFRTMLTSYASAGHTCGAANRPAQVRQQVPGLEVAAGRGVARRAPRCSKSQPHANSHIRKWLMCSWTSCGQSSTGTLAR